MRHSRYPRPDREKEMVENITRRKLAAAKRGLAAAHKREEGRPIPMFAEYAPRPVIIDESPEARIIRLHRSHNNWLVWIRQRHAGQWLAARAYLEAEEPHRRAEIYANWQKCGFPGDPTYLLGWLRNYQGVEMPPYRSPEDRRPFEVGEFAFGVIFRPEDHWNKWTVVHGLIEDRNERQCKIQGCWVDESRVYGYLDQAGECKEQQNAGTDQP